MEVSFDPRPVQIEQTRLRGTALPQWYRRFPACVGSRWQNVMAGAYEDRRSSRFGISITSYTSFTDLRCMIYFLTHKIKAPTGWANRSSCHYAEP